jgi:hypothetical protein
VASLGGVVTQILPNFKEFTPDTGMLSGMLPNGREYNFTVNVNAGTIANPDELVNLVQDSLIQINRRGGSLTQAGAL